MKIESTVNQSSVADRPAVKQREDMNKQEHNTQKANESARVDVATISRMDNSVIPVQPKAEPKERIEMSSNEMKLRTETVKANRAQDALASQQVAEQALSSLKEQGNALKELSSKHQEANPEKKVEIEAQAKEVLAKMNEISESATVKGESILEGKHNAKIPNELEKVDMKEILKPEHIEKAITKPLEEATAKASAQTEQMVASIYASQSHVVPMAKTDAVQAMQRVKESLKETEPRKVASGLDSHRANVAHLLK